MSTRYLPRLKDGTDNELMRSSQIGVWDDDPATTRLHALAKAIHVQPGATQVHSIPDPWARVILFSRALFDSKHALHRRVLGEWRGLLAILALKEIRKFSELTVVSVALDREEAPASGFLATVARMKPSAAEAFASKATWDNFHIFRWCGKLGGGAHRPFGMTSMASLVATGTSYGDVFSHEEVPWFIDGHLVDPVTPLDGEDEPPGNLSKTDRHALAEWVLYVRSTLSKLGPGNDDTYHGKLLDCLKDYADDLNEGMKDPARTPGKGSLSETGLGIVTPEYFECLDRPHKPAAKVVTDLQILPDRKVDKTYVLYDASLPRQLKKKDRDVTLFDTISMSSAPRDLIGASTRKSGVMPGDKTGEILWCAPGFFFEDDLIYEQLTSSSTGEGGSKTFPGCRAVNATGPSQDRHIVLPLTEDAARLFTPEYLAENFSIEWLTSGGARCRLKLQIRSMHNLATDSRPPESQQEEFGPSSGVVIEHLYEEKDLNKIRNLPLVCLWPNFRFDDEPRNVDLQDAGESGFRNRWKRYYLFENWIGTNRAEELVITPLDKDGMDRHLFTKNGAFQVITTPRFPAILVCQMPFTDKKPKLNDNRPPKGLLLLQDVARPAGIQGLKMALGIDFGTTGTSIYRAQMGDGGATSSPMAITFTDRVVKITGRSEDELKDATRHSFIPARIKAIGRILSVYQTHDSGSAQPEILNGHVLFQDPNVDGRSAFVWPGSEENVIRDLKWGDEQLQGDAAEAFLSQVCLQSFAELAAEGATLVDLRYSYPTAFDDNDLHRFRGIWDKVIGGIREATSIKITPAANDPSAKAESFEAVAAARYFAKTSEMTYSNGAITLDIGGGTTDIAVWKPDSAALVAHASVLFAGTDMFQAVLRRKLELLRQIDREFPLPSIDKARFSSSYFAEVDALISKYSDRLLTRLSRVSGESGEVRELVAIIQLGMSGIGFYSGLVLGRLIENGAYNIKNTTTVQVFVGGNASRLMHWCDAGRFHEGSPFYKKFSECVLAGASVGAPEKLAGKSVAIILSRLPKEEVAFGLVASDLDTVKSIDPASSLAGENFRVGESDVMSWESIPATSEMLKVGLKVERDLPIFSRFIEATDEDLNSMDKEKVVGFINDSLLKMIQRTEKKQRNDDKAAREMKKSDRLNPVRQEPLFILALKGLIDMRIRKLVKDA